MQFLRSEHCWIVEAPLDDVHSVEHRRFARRLSRLDDPLLVVCERDALALQIAQLDLADEHAHRAASILLIHFQREFRASDYGRHEPSADIELVRFIAMKKIEPPFEKRQAALLFGLALDDE